MYGNNPYFPQMQQNPYLANTQPRQEVVKVNGEGGARAYQMPPNSSALLLDESGTMIWLATTDGAGYKSVAAFDITPHQEAPAPDFGALETRITKLEEIINAYTENLAATKSAEPSAESVTAQQSKRYDPYGKDRQGPLRSDARNDK